MLKFGIYFKKVETLASISVAIQMTIVSPTSTRNGEEPKVTALFRDNRVLHRSQRRHNASLPFV